MMHGQDTVDQIRLIMGRGNPVPANAPAADWHDTHARETHDWLMAMAGTEVAVPSAQSRPASARSPRRPRPVRGRAGRVAAPITAALAVAGLIAGITLAGNSGNPPPVSRAARTGSLPLLRTDGRFGWLPAGEKLTSGFEFDNMAYMNVTAGRRFRSPGWDLTIWAAGYCVLDSGASEQLRCRSGGGVASSPMIYAVRGRAASIHGQEAFWTSYVRHHYPNEIIWEYAPGAWAVLLGLPYHGLSAATLLRIASGISFGPASGEPVRFDFQLTDVPSDWRVSMVSYGAQDGSMLANGLQVTARHNPRTQIGISVEPGGAGNADPCWRSAAGPVQHTLIRGYDVETTKRSPSDWGGSDVYDLCANNPGGVSFDITTYAYAARTPAELFEHLRFLGPGPANWAAYPIG